MKKLITLIILFIVLILTSARGTYAQNISDSSAILVNKNSISFDYRIENLRSFFEKYNSPLADFAPDFVYYADYYDLDYRLIPAITGVESTFGKRIPANSYNAYGWANGDYSFESWEDSISHVSNVLKAKYVDRGAESVSEIARIYAPPSSTWGSKVSYFVNKIDTLPLNFDI